MPLLVAIHPYLIKITLPGADLGNFGDLKKQKRLIPQGL
jgi:hypothetical protein